MLRDGRTLSAKICVGLSETAEAKCWEQNDAASKANRLNYRVEREGRGRGNKRAIPISCYAGVGELHCLARLHESLRSIISNHHRGARLPPARPELRLLLLVSKHKTMSHLGGARERLFIRVGGKREDELFSQRVFDSSSDIFEVEGGAKMDVREPRQTGGACSLTSGETNAEGRQPSGAAASLPTRKVERGKGYL